MSALPKIVIGALATTAAAWFLHSPLGLGQNCTAAAGAGGTIGIPATTDGNLTGAVAEGTSALGNAADAAASGASALGNAATAATGAALTPAQVENCQTKVTLAASAGMINFATGGTSVAASSGALLDSIAKELRDCTGASIEVAGHTDAQGDAAANQALSERRARAVVAALVDRGVPADRLTARGYGETKLLHADGPENDPRNRRIEFTVTAR
ncbi:MAG: OmpA family protein [Sphingomonas sp.]|uniref:OmpA family protein n=1 Tax=Sphingomonas sp. TaxID=28214 RepID=UPI001B2A67A1|nr:OmpA family protein [Sphingomonas sp.]MBO9623622.1 OmpA family protein [Sphingomonas sp.]